MVISSYFIFHTSKFLLIGVFDSGVGGLSVWREIRRCIPDAPLIYLADQAHVPYGPRPAHEIIQLTEACVRWLIERGCQVIVIACNTATAAALSHLRITFPHIPFVGMEPAVKPAVALTRSGVIGVLATHTTVKSERFASLVQRYAREVRVIERACPTWVALVERGEFDQPHAFAQVADDLHALLDQHVDTFVLGCTHFPFLASCIQKVIDQQPSNIAIHVIDPAPAVAQQCQRLWRAIIADPAPTRSPQHTLLTTGHHPATFAQLAFRLLNIAPAAQADFVITALPHNAISL